MLPTVVPSLLLGARTAPEDASAGVPANTDSTAGDGHWSGCRGEHREIHGPAWAAGERMKKVDEAVAAAAVAVHSHEKEVVVAAVVVAAAAAAAAVVVGAIVVVAGWGEGGDASGGGSANASANASASASASADADAGAGAGADEGASADGGADGSESGGWGPRAGFAAWRWALSSTANCCAAAEEGWRRRRSRGQWGAFAGRRRSRACPNAGLRAATEARVDRAHRPKSVAKSIVDRDRARRPKCGASRGAFGFHCSVAAAAAAAAVASSWSALSSTGRRWRLG